MLRTHEDFVPELDFVCELDGIVKELEQGFFDGRLYSQSFNHKGILKTFAG